MHYSEAAPDSILANYVDAYWTSSGSTFEKTVEKILPDGCVDIIFNLGDDCYTDNGSFLMRNERAYLVGTMTRYKETLMDSHTKLVGVRFKPGAVSAFFNLHPLSEIANQTIDLDRGFAVDLKKLTTSPDDFLNQELAKRLKKPNHHLFEQIRTIQRLKGQLRIDALASFHCTTVRQLERSFKQYLGVSPKEFVKLVRCQHVMKALEERKPGEPLLTLAHDFGYHDHAHLTKDFQCHTGCAPSSL